MESEWTHGSPVKKMKTPLTFLLSLHFIFLYSIVAFSEEVNDDAEICTGRCMVPLIDITELEDIHFRFDQYGIDNNAKKTLRENAEILKANPEMKIEIEGHCDERGGNIYNIAMGERRAQAAKEFLVSQGIDSNRINAISFGEEKPFCFESNETCWLENRRAHFILVK